LSGPSQSWSLSRSPPIIISGEAVMQRPETPFPRHWLYYIALKIVVLAAALALVLKLYGFW
jgi:hypothetical protein